MGVVHANLYAKAEGRLIDVGFTIERVKVFTARAPKVS